LLACQCMQSWCKPNHSGHLWTRHQHASRHGRLYCLQHAAGSAAALSRSVHAWPSALVAKGASGIEHDMAGADAQEMKCLEDLVLHGERTFDDGEAGRDMKRQHGFQPCQSTGFIRDWHARPAILSCHCSLKCSTAILCSADHFPACGGLPSAPGILACHCSLKCNIAMLCSAVDWPVGASLPSMPDILSCHCSLKGSTH
jgi:hypothetical protein